jgi:hypothetical protein
MNGGGGKYFASRCGLGLAVIVLLQVTLLVYNNYKQSSWSIIQKAILGLARHLAAHAFV